MLIYIVFKHRKDKMNNISQKNKKKYIQNINIEINTINIERVKIFDTILHETFSLDTQVNLAKKI